MYALVVHDSDEVKDVFTGEAKVEILSKLKESKYWEDICNRLSEEFLENSEEEDGEFDEATVTLDDITELYHDGDSEDGYTLITTK